MHMCTNCLAIGATLVPIGRDIGTQIDPERRTLALCGECEQALLSGDLKTFNQRYRSER